jgi:hypothetical protein
MQEDMSIVIYFIVVCYKDVWCELREGSEIIAPKHVAAM